MSSVNCCEHSQMVCANQQNEFSLQAACSKGISTVAEGYAYMLAPMAMHRAFTILAQQQLTSAAAATAFSTLAAPLAVAIMTPYVVKLTAWSTARAFAFSVSAVKAVYAYTMQEKREPEVQPNKMVDQNVRLSAVSVF